MTLVERFIDFSDWPTSRKSTLGGAFFVSALVVFAGLVWLSDPAWLAEPTAFRLFLFGLVLHAVFTTVSRLMYRQGHDGRWTAGYAYLCLYTLWVVVSVVALGGSATPLLAAPLVIPLINAIVYDVRMGIASFACTFVFLVTAAALNAADVLSFGPPIEWPEINGVGQFVGALVLLSFFAVWICVLVFVAVAAASLQHRRLVQAHGLIRRYVPEQVAAAVLSGRPESIGRQERRKLTIFFSDLVGFTDLSEELEPEDLAMVLHDYFTEMSAIARRHAGTIDDLVGDAIMVFFGAPDATDDRDQALRAVRMAIQMQEAMGPLNHRWESAGIPEKLQVRMGVNTGVVTVGNRSEHRATRRSGVPRCQARTPVRTSIQWPSSSDVAKPSIHWSVSTAYSSMVNASGKRRKPLRRRLHRSVLCDTRKSRSRFWLASIPRMRQALAPASGHRRDAAKPVGRSSKRRAALAD
jgi:adenylate cyclase